MTAFASDADATTNAVSYSLTDSAGGKFAIDATTGVVTVTGAIDREVDGASLNITVRATSADGSTADQGFANLAQGSAFKLKAIAEGRAGITGGAPEPQHRILFRGFVTFTAEKLGVLVRFEVR